MRLQAKSCATCIYKKASPLNAELPRLEGEIQDQYGHFKGFRICHHSNDACCRGFFEKNGHNCTPIQIASRLNIIELVNDDTLRKQDGDQSNTHR